MVHISADLELLIFEFLDLVFSEEYSLDEQDHEVPKHHERVGQREEVRVVRGLLPLLELEVSLL